MQQRMKRIVPVAVLLLLSGCLNIKAPERIDIGNSRSEPVDSSRIPPTSSHEEARRELARAYQRIQQLERDNEQRSRQVAQLKRERDEARQRRE